MNVLVLDCSSSILAVGVERNAGAAEKHLPKHPFKETGGHGSASGLVSVSIDAGFRHAERIMGAIDFCLGESGLHKSELDLLACASGPGSFTGLRIAMSTIKGLALGLGKPFVAIPTLDALAEEWHGASPVIVPVLDAKRSHFYFGVYVDGKLTSGPHDDTKEALLALVASCPEVLFAGPDAAMLQSLCLERSGLRICAYSKKAPVAALVSLALRRFLEFGPASAEESPLYLRASDAEEAAAREQHP